MKRRRARERDEATAHEQAERRREELLSDLKARLAASPPEPEPEPAPAESRDEAAPAEESAPAEEREEPTPEPEEGA